MDVIRSVCFQLAPSFSCVTNLEFVFLYKMLYQFDQKSRYRQVSQARIFLFNLLLVRCDVVLISVVNSLCFLYKNVRSNIQECIQKAYLLKIKF